MRTPAAGAHAALAWSCATVALAGALHGCGLGGERIVVAHFGDSTCSTDYLWHWQRVDAVLNAKLRAHYPEQHIASYNLCRSGEFIREFLESGRYDRDVRQRLARIDVALVRYGQNDLKYYSTDEFRRYLEELCDRIAADYPGVHLVLETNTYVDPAHGGIQTRNAKYDRYWDVLRAVAAARGYPLVDVFARRRAEVARGNWDQNRRSSKLAMQYFGRNVLDDSKDAEMVGVPGWFRDGHPNPNGVRIIADEEFRTLVATWPDRLPRAD
jgi:lysophospholipase L1-like esterase